MWKKLHRDSISPEYWEICQLNNFSQFSAFDLNLTKEPFLTNLNTIFHLNLIKFKDLLIRLRYFEAYLINIDHYYPLITTIHIHYE